LTKADPGFVSAVALAETVWVLERSYHFTDSEITAAVKEILHAEGLRVEHADEAFTAMALLKAGQGDFADALIGAINANAGCSRTLTFDRKALRLPGFEPL
jgi:predicted nucleic-acid-binding protein